MGAAVLFLNRDLKVQNHYSVLYCELGRGICLFSEMNIENEDLIGDYERLALLICRNVSENKFAYILQKLQDISSLGRNQTSVATRLNYILIVSISINHYFSDTCRIELCFWVTIKFISFFVCLFSFAPFSILNFFFAFLWRRQEIMIMWVRWVLTETIQYIHPSLMHPPHPPPLCFLSYSLPHTVLFRWWWMAAVLEARMSSCWDHTNATLSIPIQKDSLQ